MASVAEEQLRTMPIVQDLLQEQQDFHDDTTRSFHSSVEHEAWDYKGAVAYWCTCMTIEGAVLFSVGSLMMFPGTKPTDEKHEYVSRAWVDYSFMIGGWCFTFGNYLSYLNVINQNKHHKHERLHLVTWPAGQTDKGHVASLLNVLGALWYNVCTMSMFGWPPKKTLLEYNLTYVGTGVAGSVCFVVAALLQGEYNDWRRYTWSLPVWISHFNFWGAALFLLGYAVDFNHTADDMGADSVLEVSGVDCTFLFGSLCFLVGACMDLVMWQQERYGLGFAKKLQNNSAVKADFLQLVTIAATVLNITFTWVRISFAAATPHSYIRKVGGQWASGEKIIAYHVILLMLSLLHKTPKRHPYDYLTYGLRVVAAFGLLGESMELNQLISLYRSSDRIE
eukprot:gnl/TRDRNA2_/TRDRNA2_176479_c2_seq17.p1 gnl/TRDRNA2_/TRDRNA2_176479_c2~~gnl/TRDRNA2_/TRDRNA2_176479_c2_seq17.p1  ORF type:complete len:393 (+),score=52.08 gnl/TRDRNA2_/TRDRNA2_176479_c2_seq17:104-1282(+)